MKKAICLLMILVLLPIGGVLAEGEKQIALPAIFRVELTQETRYSEGEKTCLKKETLHTANPQVDQALAEITDAYETALFPQLTPAYHAWKNSRLDINIIYYRTGESWLSTMVLARETYNRVQVKSPFTTRVFDLKTGKRKLLTDLFDQDSPAWELIAGRVREHFGSIFPGDTPDMKALEGLCARESLEQAEFTLSAMELTLHFQAASVFPGRAGLVHVRFFYPELAGMMTEEGALQTDNSRWKMVAITCDDGPSYTESGKALDNIRAAGARVSYFVVGKKLGEFGDVLMREFDENHVIGCHTYHHWSGYSIKIMANRIKERTMTDELLLNLSGEAARYFRAPGGTYPPWEECGIGLPIIQWSVDTYDYTGKEAKKIFYSVRNNVSDGDIILMHDSGRQMYKAIPMIAEYLTDNGYMMVTLDELAARQGVALENNKTYHRLDDGGMLHPKN